MAEPFLSELRIFSFVFPPQGWALCNGQSLPINQNQALFSLLGTTYGGNGQTTFQLPDLRGRVPIHVGDGYPLGARGGEEAHTLTIGEMPTHTHLMGVNGTQDALSNVPTPTVSTVLGRSIGKTGQGAPSTFSPYSTTLASGTTLASTLVSTIGGSQAHTNMQPFTTLSICIALVGIFPSPN